MNLAPESGPLLNLSNGNLVMGFRFITVDYTLLVLCILMCNARALKANVVASNVALKPNAEHLEHN